MLTVCILAAAIGLQSSPAPVPIPREAPNDPTRGSNAVQPDTADKQAPAAAPAVVNPAAPEKDENAGGEVSTNNAQQTIVIREPVTISISRDLADWSYWLFSGLLVVVTSIQARLLWLTYQLTLPRLHIDHVYADGFEWGKRPVFYVVVGNSGTIAATDVRISMKVDIGDRSVAYKSGHQTIVVPARGVYACHIPNRDYLNEDDLHGLDQGMISLRISGQVQWKKIQVAYCYKYNPWSGNDRPPDLPRFVPCDFDTRQAIDLNLAPAAMGHFAATLEPSRIPRKEQPDEPDKEQE
jgi:hypothetical protein